MSSDALYRRLVRRETHSSRAKTAITIAVLLVILLAWIAVESVLAALGQPALLAAPADVVTAALGATGTPAPALVAIGAIVALVGLVLVIVALAPAGRGRRAAATDRTAVVVDDRVIAQSVARTAADAGDLSPDQVRVSVGGRSVRVDVTPFTGRSVAQQDIQRAVDEDVASYDFRPPLTARVHVSSKGRVS